ncbi:MAG: DUF3179 domain-containing protein, partial [Methanobacteriota archaeon]
RGELIDVLPKDAIPAILAPSFDADNPSWLSDGWRVIGLEIDGDARAYPIAILNWHEIVNDVVGGNAVAVTFCPLCGTAIVFDRTVGSSSLTFGVSGKLYRNDLGMYDHQTESHWAQLLGESILGEHHGTRIGTYSSSTMPWADWRADHPTTRLLDRPRDEAGNFLRNYNADPYAGYAGSESVYFPQTNVAPYDRLHPKELVLGVALGGDARAYPLSVLRDRPVVNDVLGGIPLLVTHADGVLKAWERGNRTFVASGDAAAVDEAGNTYDRLTGMGSSGPLVEIPAVTAFWFAWFDFFPATSVYGVDELPSRPTLPVSTLGLVAGVAAGAFVAAVVLARRVRRSRRSRGTARKVRSRVNGRR